MRRDGTGLSSIFLKAARIFFFCTFRRGCNCGLGLRGVEDSDICVVNVDLGCV